MRELLWTAFAATFLGRLCCAPALAADAQIDAVAAYPPLPGRPHPAFVLPSIADGKPISLAQFRGKKVLLIHFASW